MSNQKKGFMIDILGCTFWGISGTLSQFLLSHQIVSSAWLAGIRALIAGMVILSIAKFVFHAHVFAIFRNHHDFWTLMCFTFLGSLPWQFSYFLAIRFSNAPTATVLQFTGPSFIIIALTLFEHQKPRRLDIWSVVVSLLGLVLLVTDGRLTALALAPLGLFWGLVSGVSQASYSLIPRKILKKYDATVLIGWAMLLGSLLFFPILRPLPEKYVTFPVIGSLFVIVIGGTVIGYLFYFISLKYLRPTVCGMLDVFEPLTATILAVAFLGTTLTFWGIVGSILIVLTVFLQALPSHDD